MEPSGQDVRARRPAGSQQLSPAQELSRSQQLARSVAARSHLQVGAGVAATVLALTSTGDAILLAVLVTVAAADALLAGPAVAAAAAVGVRWGSTALPSLAGAQAVLGPAVAVGPAVAAASSLCAGVALIVAAPAGWAALPWGLFGGLVAAGPAVNSGAGSGAWAARGAGALLGGVGAWAAARWLPRRPALVAGWVAGAVAVVLALVA